jgi:phosphoglycolate phosphatase-like HAD superfamily hydrolase
VAVIAALFFFFGKGVVGGLLTQLSSILDGTDGEIARLKDMESSLGNFVDAILDRYADGFILFGMFYYSLVEMKGSFSPLLITGISGLAILGNIMVSYTSAKSVVNFGYRYKGRWIGAGRGRDLRLFLIFAGGVVSSIHPVAVLFALGTVAALTNIVVVWRVSLSASLKNRLYERIKAVIFDFDGTVADTMGFLTQLATELISENYNISKDEAKKRYLETTGAEFASQIETIFPSHPKNREVVELFEAKKEEDIFEHPIFPEAVSVLEYFQKKQIKSFICSSTKQEIITKYCNLYNIGHLVTDLFGQKEGFGKREQIEFILSHYGLEPEDMLFVGDSLKDYEFTKKKGIRFIGITRIFTKKRFKEKGAQSVDSLREVVKLFEL